MARAGVNYLKVNIHIDNFVIVDRLINILAPVSDLDHIAFWMSYKVSTPMYTCFLYTFLSYGYSVREYDVIS